MDALDASKARLGVAGRGRRSSWELTRVFLYSCMVSGRGIFYKERVFLSYSEQYQHPFFRVLVEFNIWHPLQPEIMGLMFK